PTRAWEELVGRPNHQVMMSHAIAPTRPAKITPFDSTLWSTTSLAMVLATAVPKITNAAKLKNAAHTTASRGASTRVETTVAIELAASWNPLKKSNASATAMIRATAMLIRAHASLTTMDSTVLAMSSQRSIADSICSRMSFHLRTSIAL